MNRSEINKLVKSASKCFQEHGWTLPPAPRWDVTDFGLGDSTHFGLVLINLAEEPEYCEKLMYAQKGMTTPAHSHKRKKEDIISRWGVLSIVVWRDSSLKTGEPLTLKVNGQHQTVRSGDTLHLQAGERVTLEPGVYHEFYAATEECIIGEVSTVNDDLHDNFFMNPEVGRYSMIKEDEVPLVKLVSDKPS